MGTLIGSAVVPIAVCITWKKANGTGAVVGAILGFCAGVAGWLGITATLNDGVVNVDTTFGDYEMLTGNLLSIGVGGIITVVWSLLRPANFDWDVTRAINAKAAGTEVTTDVDCDPTLPIPQLEKAGGTEKDISITTPLPVVEEATNELQTDEVALGKAFRFAAYAAIILTAILIFLIPLPLFFSSHGGSRAGPGVMSLPAAR
jgi:urea-proton symporter